MTIIQAFILGIIQGFTEFLPISSSGHLVLVPFLLGWNLPEDQIFPFDVLVQIGTLIAVIIFYWNDLKQIFRAMVSGIKERKPFKELQARVGWFVILATIPAGLIGLLLKDIIENAFTNPRISSVSLLITASLLLVSERIGKKSRKIPNLDWLDAITMGFAQALAVFPGISRSGSTISSGLFRNLDRKTSGQFAFLMAIPIMTAAGLLSSIDLFKMQNLKQFLPVMTVGFITAGIVGFFSIKWLLKYITNHSLTPFAIYCLVLGIGSLILTSGNSNIATINNFEPMKDNYKISYSSSSKWMVPIFSECSDNYSTSTILLKETGGELFNPEYDIHISFGEISSGPTFAYQLGSDKIVPATNKNSPIERLSIEMLQNIIGGNITSFFEITDSCDDCISADLELDVASEEMQIWVYPGESILQKAIQETFEQNFISTQAFIAPDPSLMARALLLNHTTIGFFPSKFQAEGLRPIEIVENQYSEVEIPIIAYSNDEIEGGLANFLMCITDKL